MRVIEYALLAEFDPAKLSKVVNDCLNEGWELYGSVSVTTTTSRNETLVVFSQAMVKKGEGKECPNTGTTACL